MTTAMAFSNAALHKAYLNVPEMCTDEVSERAELQSYDFMPRHAFAGQRFPTACSMRLTLLMLASSTFQQRVIRIKQVCQYINGMIWWDAAANFQNFAV